MEITHGSQSAYSYHRCRCDVCVAAKRERDREYYRRNAEARKAKQREYYRKNFAAVLSRDAEYRRTHDEQIKTAKRRYYEKNAEAAKQRTREWRAANPERHKANAARHREKYRERRRMDSLARYYKQMAENPEAVRAQRRAWVKTKKGVLANRAARSKRRGAAYTKEALEWIASLVDPRCEYCGRLATEIDHVVPIADGGTGERNNLVPSCRRCNAQKNRLGVDEFLRRRSVKET